MLASVLKPVDDTRMFEKIGITLACSGLFEVIIIAYPSENIPSHSGIEFKALPPFKRLSLGRLLGPWRVFQIINQVKPELVIINTPELLLVATMNRIFFGGKICYDVLENYYRNIRFTPAFPKLIRPVLAAFVRLAEMLTRPFVSHYFLAEKGYVNELGFAQPHTILENKLPKEISNQYVTQKTRGYSKLLFTGTLAPTTGILESIHLCKQLHAIDESFSLTIIGYCAIPRFLAKIKEEISGSAFIKLIGGDALVPHQKILSEISKADVGIVIYSVNPSTESSIPTKLFEYLSMDLPVLISHNNQSHELVERLKAGIILSKDIDYKALADQLKTKHFLPLKDPSLYWETEGQKLVKSLKFI